MLYKVKDNDFVEPFEADNEEDAAQKALVRLGFGFGSRDRIKKYGSILVLHEVGHELEIVE